ncbi:UPF0175 family protein [Spirulina sp. CS-785/01]|uniref:UPF0175 family protein n=1 Tax=Spirulina sp. CS-785/01 TaxID=3021716 RepID=UPI00232BEAFF|nr:UPF0175 family protein [Spirulina sp. CS-785/01]MDB9315011.1 UPF0175 family protein [Spirulina sp. CS-785/01]
MQIQIALPDDLAHSLQSKWGNLEHRLLEMIVIQAYQEGSISAGKIKELLSMKTTLEVDAFLKARGVNLPYSEADLEADRQVHVNLRQQGKLQTEWLKQ